MFLTKIPGEIYRERNKKYYVTASLLPYFLFFARGTLGLLLERVFFFRNFTCAFY